MHEQTRRSLCRAEPRRRLFDQRGASAIKDGAGLQPCISIILLEANHWSARDTTVETLCCGRLRESVERRGWIVIDGALASLSVADLREELACILNGKPRSRETAARTDVSGGTTEEEARAAGFHALGKTIGTMRALGRQLAVDLSDSSLSAPPNVQLACYPRGGAYYTRHTDNTLDIRTGKDHNRRAFTLIAYANGGWRPADGGCIRLHKVRGGGHVDVEPLAGRIICFNSLLPHEVLPTAASFDRYAVTLWVHRNDPFAWRALCARESVLVHGYDTRLAATHG